MLTAYHRPLLFLFLISLQGVLLAQSVQKPEADITPEG